VTGPESPEGGHLGDTVSALADGELAEADRAAAERHLDGCAECRAEWQAAVWTRDLVAGLPVLAVPAPVWATMTAVRRRRPRPVVWLSAGAAAVGIVILAVTPPRPHVTPHVARLVEVHAVSSGNDPVTQLAPAAVPASFGRP
jgi:anti-sigma factor RsiW